MKVGVVGAGLVGATTAFSMVLRGSCSELVMVDRNERRAEAEAADIAHAAPMSHAVRVSSGGYEQLNGARVVVLAAGVNQKPGESRLDLLARNAAVFRDVVPQVARAAPDAVLLVATNPVDVLTTLTARLLAHSPAQPVIGSGTVLDSARFRSLLAERSGLDPQNVHGYVLGEHGDSEVLAWSGVSVAGQALGEFLQRRGVVFDDLFRSEIDAAVRGAAAKIIAGKQATYYGIGVALARIAEAVLRDRRSVLTVSASAPGDVAYSLPRVVGGAGVLETLMPRLDAPEQEALERSVAVIRAAAAHL
ncbi:L-lactate dehydrogenase [Deinococcus alpinitundrae]|uniref:L-lactate dehydrogenase n=1 Tax=Deinococcus alpinitundrae TaxID=468913 RepID=UPI00137A8244|nr:L-lactate dehydrogenase [Deinococcus alpinitundrae]